MNANKQNLIVEQQSEGWRLAKRHKQRMEAYYPCIFTLIVFPLLQALVELSFPLQALEMIVERRDLGLLEEY